MIVSLCSRFKLVICCPVLIESVCVFQDFQKIDGFPVFIKKIKKAHLIHPVTIDNPKVPVQTPDPFTIPGLILQHRVYYGLYFLVQAFIAFLLVAFLV